MTHKYPSEEERLEARRASARNYRRRNAEKFRKYCRDWHWRNRQKACLYNLWSNARIRAREKGLEFSLNKEDIVVPEYCPILGLKMQIGFENGRESSPSLDRVDISRGYIKGNVLVISYKANRMKNNATLKELIKLGEWAKDRDKEEGGANDADIPF